MMRCDERNGASWQFALQENSLPRMTGLDQGVSLSPRYGRDKTVSAVSSRLHCELAQSARVAILAWGTRAFPMSGGHKDGNDLNRLWHDPLLKLLSGVESRTLLASHRRSGAWRTRPARWKLLG